MSPTVGLPVLEERVAEELAEDVAEKRQCNQKAHIFLLSFRLIFRLQRYTYRCTTTRYTIYNKKGRPGMPMSTAEINQMQRITRGHPASH